MSQYNVGGSKGYISDNALLRGYGVKVVGASGTVPAKVVLASAATDNIIGVTTENSSAGAVADVRLRNAEGTSLFRLGGNVAVGAKLTCDSTGRFVTTTTVGDQIVAIALEAGVVGDIIEGLNTLDRV